jgi:hypothetical protein
MNLGRRQDILVDVMRRDRQVAWRATLLAAERGVRGAALAAAAAYGTGAGVLGEAALKGVPEPAQVRHGRWCLCACV